MPQFMKAYPGTFVRAGTGPVDAVGIVVGVDPGSVVLKMMELGCTGKWEEVRLSDDEDAYNRLKIISAEEFTSLISGEIETNLNAVDKYLNAFNQTKDALERIRPVPEMIIRRVPVRDLDETLLECDKALGL